MQLAAAFGGVVIGIVVGFLVSYPVGFLRELGRERAARLISRRQDDERVRRSAAAAAATAEAYEAEADRKRQQIAAQRLERVGAKFLRHETRHDPGLQVTVLDLDDRDPLNRVTVLYTPTAGRTPTPYDPPFNKVSVEWRSLRDWKETSWAQGRPLTRDLSRRNAQFVSFQFLTESEAEQRHRVARLIELSVNDADGWVQVERVA